MNSQSKRKEGEELKDKNRSLKNTLSVLRVFLLFCCLVGSFYFATYSSSSHDTKIKAENTNTQTKLLPGDVSFSKTATPVAGMVNQWDIKLRIEACDQAPPPATDVVLVIDTSGSMNETGADKKTRMNKAKMAAEKFVKQVLKDDYVNRIALVTYNKTVTNYTFTKDNWSEQFVDSAHREMLIETINKLEASGGTHTQGGIKAATEVMKEATSARRNIVLISDGVPTYSYPPMDPYSTIAGMEKFIYHSKPEIASKYITYQTVKTIPESHFDYNDIIGLGSDYLFVGRPPHFPEPDDTKEDRLYVNHANSSIAQATIAKEEQNASGEKVVTDFYTIGLDMNLQPNPGDVPVGNETMLEIASSPEKCFSASSEDLGKIMTEIGGEIVGAVKAATVVDPMGEGFVLANNIDNGNASQGKIVVDKGKREITWDIGALTEPISSDPKESIMFAELTYRVNATTGVLDAIDDNGEAQTNGKTTISYQNYKDEIIDKEFIVPKVKPIIVSLEKKLFDAKGALIVNKTDAFKVNYGKDEFTNADLFTVHSNNEITKIVHPWRANVDYFVKEDLSNAPPYETEIQVNGQVTKGTEAPFKFIPIAGEYNHQQILITNKKIIEKKTVYLNIRQCIVQPHEELVIPSKGYYQAAFDNGTKQLNLISKSTTIDRASEIEESLFDKYEIELFKEQTYYLALKDRVPEYYRFYGYVATKNPSDLKTKHLSTNTAELIKTNEAKLDYEASDSYWITMFITPDFGKNINNSPEESPKPYSWSYKTNNFNK